MPGRLCFIHAKTSSLCYLLLHISSESAVEDVLGRWPTCCCSCRTGGELLPDLRKLIRSNKTGQQRTHPDYKRKFCEIGQKHFSTDIPNSWKQRSCQNQEMSTFLRQCGHISTVIPATQQPSCTKLECMASVDQKYVGGLRGITLRFLHKINIKTEAEEEKPRIQRPQEKEELPSACPR